MILRTLLFLLPLGIFASPQVSSWQCCWWTSSSSETQQPPPLFHSFSQELSLNSGPQQFEDQVQSIVQQQQLPAYDPPVVRQRVSSSSSHTREYEFVSNRTSSGTSSDGTLVRSRAHRRVAGKNYHYQNSRQLRDRVVPAVAPEPAPMAVPVPPSVPVVTNRAWETSYWTTFRCRVAFSVEACGQCC